MLLPDIKTVGLFLITALAEIVGSAVALLGMAIIMLGPRTD